MSNTPSNEDLKSTAQIALDMVKKLDKMTSENVTVNKDKLAGTWSSVYNLSNIVLNLRQHIKTIKEGHDE